MFATTLLGLQYVTAPVEEKNPVGLDLRPSHDCAQKSGKVRGTCGESRLLLLTSAVRRLDSQRLVCRMTALG